MKQSRGDSLLEIYISHTIDVITTIRTAEEDMMPSCIARVSSPGHERHLAPLSSLGTTQYTLVRLSKVGDGNILNILDIQLWTVNEVISIEELNDGSWEMTVLKSYCSILQVMLGKIFPSSDVDLNYDPTESAVNEVENLDYSGAKTLCQHLFIKRAERMVKKGWPMAAACYDHLTARINGPRRARSHL